MSIKQGGVLIAGGGTGGGGVATNIDNHTITNNSSNEIQTVAKINQNAAIGAEPYLFDWVGTLSQYNTQQIETTHPEWICYITDDSAGSTINNSTITITQGGVTKGSFTLNQANNQTIALDAGGGSGSEDIEFATYGSTTFQEITNWYNAGKMVYLILQGASAELIYSLFQIDDSAIYFRAPTDTNGYSRLAMITSSDSWTQDTGYAAFKTQYSTMPTAGALYTTRSIQYIGATDQNYTNGYFYISVYNGSTYSWSRIDVQPSNNGHNVVAFQAPTSANGYKYYTRYSDNWVEQGCLSASVGTQTLPVEMASATDYSISTTPLGTGTNTDIHAIQISTTQIDIGNSENWNMSWEVKGIAA